MLHGVGKLAHRQRSQGETRSRLLDLEARAEEGDDEKRHYSDQNVDDAAHHDPADSSYRCPFRRCDRNWLGEPDRLAAAAAEDRD
jgi:hypothetical protein